MKKLFFLLAAVLILSLSNTTAQADRIERLKSQVKRGVDYYRDGRFTISKLTKQPLRNESTIIRGFITNDTTRRAVSVQLEITCYNQAGDLLGTELVEINYLDSQQTQQFEARFRENPNQITLFEAAIQDAVWDEEF